MTDSDHIVEETSFTSNAEPIFQVWSQIDLPSYHDSLDFADLRIIAKDGEVSAHRFVLAAACPLLRYGLAASECCGEEAILSLPDYEVSQVKQLLKVIYGKSQDLSELSQEILDLTGLHVTENFTAFQMGQYRPKIRKRRRSQHLVIPVDPTPVSQTTSKATISEVKAEFPEGNTLDKIDSILVNEDEPSPKRVRGSSQMHPFQKTVVDVPTLVSNFEVDRTGRYICPFLNCEHLSVTRDVLQNHIMTNHTMSKCGICGERVRMKDLSIHVARYNF